MLFMTATARSAPLLHKQKTCASLTDDEQQMRHFDPDFVRRIKGIYYVPI